MKKLMLFAVLLTAMIALTNNVSAQMPFPITSGAGTPAVGQELLFDLHARRNDEPKAPSGTKYLVMKFSQKNQAPFMGMKQLSADEVKKLSGLEGDGVVKYTITKVENPLNVGMYGVMNTTFYKSALRDQEIIQIEVIQSGKNMGKMKVHLKKS